MANASAGNPTGSQRGAARAFGLGSLVGLVGAGMVGLGEFAVAAGGALRAEWGERIPAFLLMGSLGELLWSQLMVWVPLAAIAAGLHGWARGRGAVASSAGFGAAVSVGGAAATFALAHRALPRSLAAFDEVAGLLAAVVLGLAAHRIVSGLARRSPSRARATLVATAAVMGAVAVGSGLAFARSPFFDPGGFRARVSAEPSTVRPDSPHVLWIVLDTVRADRLSVHGSPRATTPFLEEWSASSYVFDTAIADGTWTSPSHASMFTGRSVREHGVGRTTLVLDPQFETVAESLAAAGYQTASFSNNPLIGGSESGLDRGFATAAVPARLRVLSRPSLERLVERLGIVPPLPWLDRDNGAAITSAVAERWLRATDATRPVFLFVNLAEAHLPWDVPRAYRRQFLDEAGAARSRRLRRHVYGDLEAALNQRVAAEGDGFIAPADREILRSQYDATLRYLDARTAELVGLFEGSGLLDHTLVVVTSDHGEYLGTHDLWSHLYRTYEDLVHVPLLIRPAGGTEARRIDRPVQLSDLHATVLLQALGPRSGVDPERDLTRAASRDATDGFVVSEAGDYGARAGTAQQSFRAPETKRGRKLARPEVAIRNARFKLVRPERGRPELYDLENDPDEQRSQLSRFRDEARALATELRRWEESRPAHAPSMDALLEPGNEMRRALLELGYIEE